MKCAGMIITFRLEFERKHETRFASISDNTITNSLDLKILRIFFSFLLFFGLANNCLEGAATFHFKTLIPSVAAGAIIGKGGETIAALQKETGARVKMSKSHDFYPGTYIKLPRIYFPGHPGKSDKFHI